jgi:hypothetical protein
MDRVALREILSDRFNLDELRTLCFDLHIEFENLGGETKRAKAREIVAYCERAGRLDVLVAAVRKLRPDLNPHVDVRAEFYSRLTRPTIESIENDTRRRNLNRGHWAYDEFLNALRGTGWIRFAAGFKAGIYAHEKYGWCIKVLGMGVGDNPSYFCERGYYLEHERNMLLAFKAAGFNFQPRVMTQEEATSFLVQECGVTKDQAAARSNSNDILIMELLPGIPLLTQTGRHLECEIHPCLMDEGVLRDVGSSLEFLKVQLDKANARGLLHNDPVGFNIVLTLGTENKVTAKLVDFELSQNLNTQSPAYVNASVEELYRERAVPRNPQTGRHISNLDQHLMRESLQIVEQLADKLKKLKDPDSSFQSVLSIGPFSSSIEINLENVTTYLRERNEL